MRSYTTENKTLPNFPSWTSPVRPRSPAPSFQSLGKIQQLLSLHFTPLSHQNRIFKLFCRFRALLRTGLRVHIKCYTDAVPALICGHFRVNSSILPKIGMGPAHHLEV